MTTSSRGTFALLALVALGGSAVAAQSIRGKVVDAASGEGVKGAEIEALEIPAPRACRRSGAAT